MANTRIAVVTQREVVMRLGPFEESQSALTLKDGAELRILDEKADWLQVTPGNEAVGWVPTRAVDQIHG
jgi:SH3-like domain-containing protein